MMVLHHLAVGLALCLPGPAAIERARIHRANIIEEFDWNADDAVILPVRFGGKEYPFVLDTGSSVVLFDSGFREDLGWPVGQGAAQASRGQVTIERFQCPAIGLKSLNLRSAEQVAAFDLQGFREAAGCDIRGVLGMSVLHNLIMQLDRDAGKVRFLRTVPSDRGSAVHLGLDGGCPRIRVRLPGGRKVSALVDTGYNGTGALSKGLFVSLLESKHLIAFGQSDFESIGGGGVARDGLLDYVTVAGHTHAGLIVSEGNGSAIGLAYLSRYVVTFDFPKQTLYLRKGRDYEKPEPHERIGLAVVRSGGKTLVHAVKKGSPAEAGGIQPKDEILEISVTEPEQPDQRNVRRRGRHGGTTFRVKLRRADRVIEVALQLRDYRKAEK